MSKETSELDKEKDIFDAYVSLRKIAQQYQLEEKLAIPRVVFVGETSSGKSMLVQNFLRFPCAFSQGDVGTRCPVLYRLRYNPTLKDNSILIKHPPGIKRAEDLADHLREVMKKIEQEDGFRLDEYLVHIESNQYKDFEILDVPGLIGGSHDSKHLKAVEEITEHYVRDPTFLIVQLKEATQIGVNSTGTKRIRDFCLLDPAPCGSPLPPRIDYENYTITIQTKFDLFIDGHRDGSHANEDMNKLLEHFHQRTLFVSMIFDVYNFTKNTYNDNQQYIANLPELERQKVDKWISSMKKLTQQNNSKYEEFDETRFRPLIGINVVRSSIQDMWVQAFRSAIPKIQQVLTELVQEQKLRYNNIVSIVEEKDLNTIRSTYQNYIEAFRSKLTDYVNWRAEVNSQFELEIYGRTYQQIEEEYNQWLRKYPLTWCAYQTAEQLSDQSLYSLPFRCVGSRHFERIRQVFFYMILTYQPVSHEQEWFESAQGLLYGITTDGENLEKGVRELLYTYIRETFALGICWLTQIYSFLIDHFERHVSNVLLSPQSPYAHLSHGHTKFLSYLRLEYHRTTRQFIRDAVLATKHARYAKMIYASHSIANFLPTLVESFPPTIKSNQQKEYPISVHNSLKLIFDTNNSLPENRNPQTGNYLPATRHVINELYTAVRGLLLNDITTNFFANIVINLSTYNSIKITNPLQYRIYKMSNKQIAHMSHINFDEHIQELQEIYEKLKILEETCEQIEQVNQLFNRKTTSDPTRKITYSDKRDRNHQELMKKLYEIKIKKTEDNQMESTVDEDSDDENDIDKDEKELKLLDNDSSTCETFLLELFQRHDLEDLKYGFLEGDNFDMNKKKKNIKEKRVPVADTKQKSVSQVTKDTGSTNSDEDRNGSNKSLSTTSNDDKSKIKTTPKLVPRT